MSNEISMAAMMMGGQREAKIVAKQARERGPVALELKAVCANKDSGVPAVSGATLEVHEGEIVGIAGISGNGQREFYQAVMTNLASYDSVVSSGSGSGSGSGARWPTRSNPA